MAVPVAPSRPFFRRFFRGGDASKKAARSESQQRKIGLAGRDWRSSSVLTPPRRGTTRENTALSPLRSLSLLWLLLPPRPRSFSLASTPVSSPFPLRRPPDARLWSSFSHHHRRQTTHSHAARTEVSFQPRLSSLSPGSFLSPRRRRSSPLSFIPVFARSSAFVEFVLSPVSQAFPNRLLSRSAGSAGSRFSSTPLCVSFAPFPSCSTPGSIVPLRLKRDDGRGWKRRVWKNGRGRGGRGRSYSEVLPARRRFLRY